MPSVAQTRDLIALPAPDVHDWRLGRPVALFHLGVPEHDDGVAVLEELVG